MFDKDRRRHYKGKTDALDLRVGLGEQTFCSKEGEETYVGPFRRDIYHGIGQYLSRTIFREPWSYEGRFQMNRKEGYGTLSFADNSIFSGLYKDDRAFGPGVLTYSDGKQDVGIWLGSKLLRLCIPVGSIESLCKTVKDRLQAVNYKNLIKISNDQKEGIATEIMLKVNANAKIVAQAHKLYSRHCKNPTSHLFDRRQIQDDLDDLRNVEDSLIELQQSRAGGPLISVDIDIVRTKHRFTKVSESDYNRNKEEAVLVAWNNQQNVIDIMKHTFRYRRQECVTHFNFGDILCNRRTCFGEKGDKESASIQMLLASEQNDSRKILDLLKKYKLNIDVMDRRGNSMILLAAAKDAHNVINMLSEVFCNLNAVNDEGFNALNHTLTRYLSLMYDIYNWAKGFMPPNDAEEKGSDETGWLEDCIRSMTSNSSLGLSGKLRRTPSQSFEESINGTKYLFNLRQISATSKKPMSSKKKSSKLQKTRNQPEMKITTVKSRSLMKTRTHPSKSQKLTVFLEENYNQKKLMQIEETINLLLDLGVDVNASVTPAPLWVLALFAGNVRIIEKLLKNGVDPNKNLNIDKGLLTPLHVLVLAKPVSNFPKIAELLLQYDADPHIRTNADYWTDLWNFLGDFGVTYDLLRGMNPLHALILRPTVDNPEDQKCLDDIGCILAWNTREDEHFHGLTPLGLAIANGNLHMVDLLLKCAKVQINSKFDEFWGNPLTTYLRTQGTNNSNEAYKMLDLLLKFGADPLEEHVTSQEGNILNFSSSLKQSLFKAIIPSSGASSVKSRRGSHINEKKMIESFESKEAILKKLAKKKVERFIQGKLVRTVLHCMQEKLSEDMHLVEVFSRVMEHIGDWINFDELPELMWKNLEITELKDGLALVNALQIFPDIFPQNPYNTKDSKFFRYSGLSIRTHRGKSLKDVDNKTEETGRLSQDVNLENNFSEKLNDIKECARLHNYSRRTPPEIDTNGKLYEVCYECLRRNPQNMLCPKCQLVYFCSEECNNSDARNLKSRHKCKLVFFGLSPEEYFLFGATSGGSGLEIFSETSSMGLLNKGRPDAYSGKRQSMKFKTEEEIMKEKFEKDNMKASFTLEEISGQLSRKKSKQKKEKSKKSDKLVASSPHEKEKSKSARGSKKSRTHKEKGRTSRISKKGSKVNVPRRTKYERGITKHKGRSSKLGASTIGRSRETLLTTYPGILGRITPTIFEEIDAMEKILLSLTLKEKHSEFNISYDILGERAELEEYWDRNEETKYSLQERLAVFLYLLYNKYGDSFDIDKFLPFVTYRYGNLYYKFYKEKPNNESALENYSFN